MSIEASNMTPSDALSDRQHDYWVAWLSTFLFFVAFYALIVPLPRYLTGVGLADWQVGLVLGATGMASLVMRPISGVLTDRIGYKRMLLYGAMSLVIGSTGVVFTTQVALLFILRVLQAVGYVIFTTAGNALVGQLALPSERSSKIAYFGLAANFAMTMTPGITDSALPWIGVTTAFWIAGGVAVVAGVLTRLLRVAPPQASTERRQPLNIAHFWHFPRVLWLPMFVSALFGAGFGAYFQYFAVLLERRELAAAPVYAAYGLGIIAIRLLLGRFLDRIGLGRVLIISAVTMAIGLLIAAIGTTLPLVIISAALIAAGGGFFHPMLIAHHVTLLPARPGWAVACFYLGFDVGIGVGAWLLGLVLDLSGLTTLFVVAAALTVATICFIPALTKGDNLRQL